MTDVKPPRTRPEQPAREPAPALGPLAMGRWAWRQLTSMRTALILLFLLALGSVPGSVIPQVKVDSLRASQWQQQHPTLTPIYDKLGLFSVYDSVWFSAIYLLLMVSLVGCIIPRTRVYWAGVRARPPRVPRFLDRMPGHRTIESDLPPDQARDAVLTALRRRRYRVDTTTEGTEGAEGGVASFAAERGHLREAGNLLFHLSVLIVLVGFAVGGLWGYKGGVIVPTRDGFANTLSQYDDFRGGGLFQPRNLTPFDLTVDDFAVQFIRSGRSAGMAHKFSADLTYHESPAAPARRTTLSVNHPLKIHGADVFLISHGYAPHITVRNADGTIAYAGAVPFLPEDATFRSFGVVKVTDATQRAGGRDQIGLEGEFFPTYAERGDHQSFSAYPDAYRPAVQLQVWRGDLGLDQGQTQSVYALDKKGMARVLAPDGRRPLLLTLGKGQTEQLPGGLGSVRFDGVSRYVKLQISHTPAQWVTLLGVVLALVGLLGSLFVRSRRIWVRARRDGARTLVEIAGLDRNAGGDLTEEVDRLAAALRRPADDVRRDEERV